MGFRVDVTTHFRWLFSNDFLAVIIKILVYFVYIKRKL